MFKLKIKFSTINKKIKEYSQLKTKESKEWKVTLYFIEFQLDWWKLRGTMMFL